MKPTLSQASIRTLYKKNSSDFYKNYFKSYCKKIHFNPDNYKFFSYNSWTESDIKMKPTLSQASIRTLYDKNSKDF